MTLICLPTACTARSAAPFARLSPAPEFSKMVGASLLRLTSSWRLFQAASPSHRKINS